MAGLVDVDGAHDVGRGLDEAAHRQLGQVHGVGPEGAGRDVAVRVVAEHEALGQGGGRRVVEAAEGEVEPRVRLAEAGGAVRHSPEGQGVVGADEDDVPEVLEADAEIVDGLVDLGHDLVGGRGRARIGVPGVVGRGHAAVAVDGDDRAADVELVAGRVVVGRQLVELRHDVAGGSGAVQVAEPLLVHEEEGPGAGVEARRQTALGPGRADGASGARQGHAAPAPSRGAGRAAGWRHR